ncbi:hypothetical protein C5750_06675 [Phyllobacterium myrsinacearum]|uniref:Uncharacterized protein n=1 Tax=Phyllobacterium myrsinacearum TaxID=28101 RepID=A0A2S9JZJ6_9HYPH|nr:hypothetical protein C5750_06675 [Phyllobacterium myrsinacearum]
MTRSGSTKAVDASHGLNRLPKAQETRLARILGNKDLAQYGGRFMLLSDAQSLLTQLEEYAAWAESEMTRA